jgi:hypothetical protein
MLAGPTGTIGDHGMFLSFSDTCITTYNYVMLGI